MDLVVSPFDHRYEEPISDVRIWLPPAQISTVPEGVIAGVEGRGLTVTTVVPEGTLVHPAAFVT